MIYIHVHVCVRVHTHTHTYTHTYTHAPLIDHGIKLLEEGRVRLVVRDRAGVEVHDDIITTHYSLHDVNKVGNCLGGGREEGGEGGRDGEAGREGRRKK